MKFVSTRGGSRRGSERGDHAGIGADGGLFVPERLPACHGRSFREALPPSPSG
jgi:hypothetical protein